MPKCANTSWVNPEQSAPLVRLVPPYTYGFPKNCFAYATIAVLVADTTAAELPGPATGEDRVVVDGPEELVWLEPFGAELFCAEPVWDGLF